MSDWICCQFVCCSHAALPYFHQQRIVAVCYFANRKQVRDSRLEAEKDGVVVPVTVKDYCVTAMPKVEQQASCDFDFYDDYSADADDSDGEINYQIADVRKGESRHGSA